MSEEIKCTICEADFRPNAITELPAGVPKCPECVSTYPDAVTRAEVQVFNKNKAQELSEARVIALIYEKLEEANIKRVPCDECKELFFRKNPAQKYCSKCKAKREEK